MLSCLEMVLSKKTIITVLGTRPEIVKLSAIIPLLDEHFHHILIHTGQHYDYNMDEVFFKELGLRKPDYMLAVGSGSHAGQTAAMMIKLEPIFIAQKPDYVITYADTNTPLAAALVAVKMHIPIIHLEAGCRSFNKKMPEEINRVLCGHCASLHLAPDKKAFGNLVREGVNPDLIHIVGSTAVQASLRNVKLARESSRIVSHLGLEKEKYVVATIHRAENTNDPTVLQGLLDALGEIAQKSAVVFPMHPRTKQAIASQGLRVPNSILITEPLGYLDMLSLVEGAKLVMSDSGGVQEEAAALNTPCLVLRNETEWTYLTDAGKNLLLGTNKDKIVDTTCALLADKARVEAMKSVRLDLNMDAAERIVDVIKTQSYR